MLRERRSQRTPTGDGVYLARAEGDQPFTAAQVAPAHDAISVALSVNDQGDGAVTFIEHYDPLTRLIALRGTAPVGAPTEIPGNYNALTESITLASGETVLIARRSTEVHGIVFVPEVGIVPERELSFDGVDLSEVLSGWREGAWLFAGQPNFQNTEPLGFGIYHFGGQGWQEAPRLGEGVVSGNANRLGVMDASMHKDGTGIFVGSSWATADGAQDGLFVSLYD